MRPLIIILALVLASCLPSKVRMVDKTGDDFKLSKRQGVVVARVINASSYTQTFNFLTLSPKDVFEKKQNKFQRIESVKKLAGKTTIFASPLPAGDYSLSDVFSYHVYEKYIQQAYGDVDLKFGTFRVEPGKVTNLGTIIYYRKQDGGKYIPLVARQDKFNEALFYLETELPVLYKQVDTVNLLSWNEDSHAAERRDLYLNVAQHPVTFDIAYPQEDGSWYFPCKLGVLLQRTAKGKWVIDAPDTDYDLMLFNRSADGDMVVVDERGDISFKGKNARSWISVAAPIKDTTAHIQLGKAGDIYLIYLLEGEIKVYSGQASAAPGWAVSLSYKSYRGWISPGGQKPATPTVLRRKPEVRNFSAVAVGDKILVTVNEKLYELDPKSGRVAEAPVDFAVIEIERTAHNQLSMVGNGPLGMIRQYSLDAGASWRPFSNRLDNCPRDNKTDICKKRFRLRKDVLNPVLFADGKGYSVSEKTNLHVAPEDRITYELVVSKDGGKTWAKSANELPKFCGGLRKGPDDKTLLLSCENTTGQFYKADRETLEWEIDYQPALF